MRNNAERIIALKKTLFEKLILLLLVFGFVLSFAACGSDREDDEELDNPTVENPDKISGTSASNKTIEMPYDSGYSFNPFSGTGLYNMAVCDLLYENIYDLDGKLNPVSTICESYSTSDGIRYYFYLKEGLTFYDGTPLTAYDVVYSIGIARGNTKYIRRLECIRGVSASSDTMFSVTLKYPNYSFPSLLSVKVVKSGTVSSSTIAVGSGPYVYTVTENGPVLIENQYYRDQSKIFTDKIALVDISTINFTDAFENGWIDIVSLDPADKLNQYVRSDRELYYYNSNVLQYLGFNYNMASTENYALRTAISRCIDRSYISGRIMENGTTPAPLILNAQLSSAYNTDWEEKSSCDLEVARTILRNANIVDFNGDGYVDYPTTGSATGFVEFTLTFIVNNDSPEKVRTAEYIVSCIEELGIRINLSVLPWNDYLMALTNDEYSIYLAEVGIAPDHNFIPLLDPEATLNYGNMNNKTYVDMVYAFLAAGTDEEKMAKAEALCTAVAEYSPIVPIGYKRYVLMTHRQQIEGIAPNLSNLFFSPKQYE